MEDVNNQLPSNDLPNSLDALANTLKTFTSGDKQLGALFGRVEGVVHHYQADVSTVDQEVDGEPYL